MKEIDAKCVNCFYYLDYVCNNGIEDKCTYTKKIELQLLDGG